MLFKCSGNCLIGNVLFINSLTSTVTYTASQALHEHDEKLFPYTVKSKQLITFFFRQKKKKKKKKKFERFYYIFSLAKFFLERFLYILFLNTNTVGNIPMCFLA